MKRILMMALSWSLVAGVASADIRIDPRPSKPPARSPAVSEAPSTPPAVSGSPGPPPAVTDKPATPHPVTETPPTSPGVESRGWGARYAMAPEWVLALGVLGLGLWGLRRTSPRPVAV